MKIVLTGASGFLGWHTWARLRALTEHTVIPIGRSDWTGLAAKARVADAIIHVAGVNRGTEAAVERGNIDLAQAVADAARASGSASRIIFANSIQSGSDTPYGRGKRLASKLLAGAAADIGAKFVDVRLPNLFGEHGRPQYNSFVATFVGAVVNNELPWISDRPVELLHAQGAAQALIGGLTDANPDLRPTGIETTVQCVFNTLQTFNGLYSAGDIPALPTTFDVDLFNTLRSGRFPSLYPIVFSPRADQRGTLVEVVRAHGVQGQTFVSTTRSGSTRGQHFHLRKIERFVVLSGTARISLRKLFTDRVVHFDVTGAEHVAIDMPTMWVHNITNVGSSELTTLFWANELFDPEAPDTFAEPVGLTCVGER